VLLSAAFAVGCAHSQKRKTEEVEELLAAAGFTMKPADTPEKFAKLQAMEQHKILAHSMDDGVYFTYADAEDCRCLFAGDQAAYQRFHELAVKKEIAQDIREAAEARERAAMDWGYWGPWPWWGW
jgi:hypothetical protein